MVGIEHGPHVLVGYDRSTGSEQAVHFAVTEARMRRLPLTICHVWQWLYPEEFKKTSTLEGGALDRWAHPGEGSRTPGEADRVLEVMA